MPLLLILQISIAVFGILENLKIEKKNSPPSNMPMIGFERIFRNTGLSLMTGAGFRIRSASFLVESNTTRWAGSPKAPKRPQGGEDMRNVNVFELNAGAESKSFDSPKDLTFSF